MKWFMLGAIALVLAACDDKSGVMREIERAEAEKASAAANAAARSEEFLKQASAKEGAETLPSGLVVSFNRRAPAGGAPKAPAEALVLVHYEGKLADGSVFDSSYGGEPAQFPLNGVVPGFSEAIQQMRPGDEIVAVMPAALGYGAEGSPPVIPPNAALSFRIELLAYRAPDGRVFTAPR